jgi:hypothetical protein
MLYILLRGHCYNSILNAQIETGECLVSFSVESFVFQFTIQKCKD